MFPTKIACLLLLFAVAEIVLAKVSRSEESPEKLKYIEPDVRRYTNVIPPEVCRKIIELGEAAGFAMDHDSIDEQELKASENNRSQAIDVMDEDGSINQPAIYEQLKPYIPNIAKLIKNQRNDVLDRMLFPDEPADRLPRLGWIFYRKYSPDSPRNSLIPHFDDNMFTVNVALNDDFTGGGVFYVKPTYELNPDWDPDQEFNFFRGSEGDGVPDLADYQYTYKWVDSLTKGNTSDVVFPQLATGDALIHNYTVWHAVAPLETGIRYSMVLFFDMHNPMLNGNSNEDEEAEEDEFDEVEEEEFDENEIEIDEEDVGDFDGEGEHVEGDENDVEDEYVPQVPIVISLRHNIRDCDPSSGKLDLIEDGIDIVYVDKGADDPNDILVIIDTNIRPGQKDGRFNSYPGHEFRAVRSLKEGEEIPPLESREVLSTVVIEDDKSKKEYEFVSKEGWVSDCEKIAEAFQRKMLKKEL